MRLTSIKLAGFKSFVDPVHIPIVGQMVGVVGPNGCGKSNVIDAVRWVLGESQAKHLRGASMADVIFNGSSSRAAISRASVELVFDNSEGRAPGVWSQYAELSLKRVLNRNGDSMYSINHTQVRRRDVLDVFSGTGLSARTPYAIIEQGMIARIIEAKPDELRGFLEEAAGISRYKERRRETESRLASVQENLLRLADVRQTLAEQITRLEEQAGSARLWQSLHAELLTEQQLLWLVKQRDAQDKFHQHDRQTHELQQRIAQHSDQLAAMETQQVLLRERHDTFSSELNQAQADFYAAATEVSRLEQDVRHIAESQQRLNTQLHQVEAQHQALHAQSIQSDEKLTHSRERLREAQLSLDAHQRLLHQLTQEIEQRVSVERDARAHAASCQRELAQSEQAVQVSLTHLQHTDKSLEQNLSRLKRLQHEVQGLATVDHNALTRLAEQQNALTTDLHASDAWVVGLTQHLAELTQQRHPLHESLQHGQQQLHHAQGQLSGLTQAQHLDTHLHELESWLIQHKLEHLPRLWQVIHVEPGWETAVESVLGARLQALLVSHDMEQALQLAPPGTVWINTSSQEALEQSSDGVLMNKISPPSGTRTALYNWLNNSLVNESLNTALHQRERLNHDKQWVTRDGHLVTRYSVQLHGANDAQAGILARQVAIEHLQYDIAVLTEQDNQFTTALTQIDETLARQRAQHELARSRSTQAQARLHQVQLDHSRQQQVQERLTQQREKLSLEISELDITVAKEEQRKQQHAQQLSQQRDLLAQQRSALDSARTVRQQHETLLSQQHVSQRKLEHIIHELQTTIRVEGFKIDDLQRLQVDCAQRLTQLTHQTQTLHSELQHLDSSVPQSALEQALLQRQHAEQQLAMHRADLEHMVIQLRKHEESRLQRQHELNPLHGQLDTARLQRQEAELVMAQCQEQLHSLTADATTLTTQLSAQIAVAHLSQLNQSIQQLNQRIQSLGAVNLLALDELTHAQQREQYLHEQSDDLYTAIATLQQAMEAMDQETRALFKSTFTTVNTTMAQLFATLFGGGQAALSLTDGEWLTAGVHVMAQPPGKKNSSIHLLSGGEKALTALSLIFALFKLSPAPFCLLDEVDAPLDDTNTERYVRLVRQMSSTVQFLFITHNRITMEAAEQLIGVTMQEPGISRIVTVDLGQYTTGM